MTLSSSSSAAAEIGFAILAEWALQLLDSTVSPSMCASLSTASQAKATYIEEFQTTFPKQGQELGSLLPKVSEPGIHKAGRRART